MQLHICWILLIIIPRQREQQHTDERKKERMHSVFRFMKKIRRINSAYLHLVF